MPSVARAVGVPPDLHGVRMARARRHVSCTRTPEPVCDSNMYTAVLYICQYSYTVYMCGIGTLYRTHSRNHTQIIHSVSRERGERITCSKRFVVDRSYPRNMNAVQARVDRLVSVKSAWRRLQLLARALIVGTFIDDCVRIATDYSGQVESMRTVGFADALASLLPALFCLVQGAGASLVLSGNARFVQLGCVVLMLWTSAHPFLYQQQRNTEFVVEEISIIGGLLILLSSTRATIRGLSPEEGEERQVAVDRLQLSGRCCLSALYLYYAQKMARERLNALSSNGVHEVPMVAAAEAVLLALILPITGLLVVGMRSRWSAFVLAAITFLAALYSHPWYVVLWSDRNYTLEEVIGYEGTVVPAWVYATHQRYFFFQQWATAGALLQLVVYGPGRLSVDEAVHGETGHLLDIEAKARD